MGAPCTVALHPIMYISAYPFRKRHDDVYFILFLLFNFFRIPSPTTNLILSFRLMFIFSNLIFIIIITKLKISRANFNRLKLLIIIHPLIGWLTFTFFKARLKIMATKNLEMPPHIFKEYKLSPSSSRGLSNFLFYLLVYEIALLG